MDKIKTAPRFAGAPSLGTAWEGNEKRLYGLGPDSRARRRGSSARKCAAARFFLSGLVDFDGTFEVRAVFNHDARGGQVAVHRAVLLDLDAVLGAQIPLHRAVDHDFTGDNIGGHLGGGANGELALVQLHQALDRSFKE